MSELVLDRSDTFYADVVNGLSRRQKAVPSCYFYDRRGSELFEDITRLPEYYPTRVETALLKTHAHDIANLVGKGRTVVEFGSGSSVKTPILLAAVDAPVYVPIDISGDYLECAAAGLATAHPGLDVIPVIEDFTRPFDLPPLDGPLAGFFPGSTLGNVNLLRSFRKILGEGARLVIGLDRRKNQRMLEAAYDDAEGVTAEFNINLLRRINRELEATIPIDDFEHRAVWHDGKGRVEMHLVAMRNMVFDVGDQRFDMREGETIHTENSYKYSLEEARMIARASGWEPMAMWTDADALFSLHVWAADESVGED
jgi:L-histidine Nalpha-methyltransferase